MIHININGKIVQAKEGEMLLTIIRREQIDIPSLCHHEAVEPSGACRLCMVEITKPEWDGWCDYVTSCLYPAVDGLIVNTHAPKVNELRASLLDLFLARHPHSKEIRQLAADYGVLKTQFDTIEDGNNCILCGICTRICDAMGFHAISMVGRGHGKEVAPPLDKAPDACVGCLACAKNCPTNYIEYSMTSNSLTIWKKDFEMVACKECGTTIITKEFADYLTTNREIPDDYYDKCDDCHRKELAGTMGRISNWDREARHE